MHAPNRRKRPSARNASRSKQKRPAQAVDDAERTVEKASKELESLFQISIDVAE